MLQGATLFVASERSANSGLAAPQRSSTARRARTSRSSWSRGRLRSDTGGICVLHDSWRPDGAGPASVSELRAACAPQTHCRRPAPRCRSRSRACGPRHPSSSVAAGSVAPRSIACTPTTSQRLRCRRRRRRNARRVFDQLAAGVARCRPCSVPASRYGLEHAVDALLNRRVRTHVPSTTAAAVDEPYPPPRSW